MLRVGEAPSLIPQPPSGGFLKDTTPVASKGPLIWLGTGLQSGFFFRKKRSIPYIYDSE